MDTTVSGRALGGAVLGWLGVTVYGIWVVAGEGTSDNWEQPYMLFSIALLVATVSTLAVGAAVSRDTDRPVARWFGIGFGVLAVAGSVVAWALPLWMTLVALSAVGFTLASGRSVRPGLAGLAAAQVIGMAAMYAAIQAEVGPRDSYGDYPVAFGIGLIVAPAVSALALAVAARAWSGAGRDDAKRLGHPAPVRP